MARERIRKITMAELDRAIKLFREFNLKPAAYVILRDGGVRIEAEGVQQTASLSDDLDTELSQFRRRNGHD